MLILLSFIFPVEYLKQTFDFFFQHGNLDIHLRKHNDKRNQRQKHGPTLCQCFKKLHYLNVIDAHTTPPIAIIITPATRINTLSSLFNRALI